MSRLTALFATCALAACGMEDIVETAESALGGAGCPSWGCPDNSPLMGPYDFWEGNTAGEENAQHMRFTALVKADVPYEAQIIGDQLRAVHKASNTELSGADLEGAYFKITGPGGDYELVIAKVNEKATSLVKFWVGPEDSIETYELRYRPAGMAIEWGLGETLCGNPPGRDAGEGNGRTWQEPFEAILFTGDRYDAATRKVVDISARGTNNWFTIACAGSALAKLHLTRHTTVGSVGAFRTSREQRQALLKMYSSDICGGGTPYTHPGVPLRWQDRRGWSELGGTEFAFEARWNEHGALCMDTHRLGLLYTTQFQTECATLGKTLLPCGGDVGAPTFADGAYIVTAVPDPV